MFFITIVGIIAAVMLEPKQKIYPRYLILILILILALLELSLSFDNAVINAKVLANMPKKMAKISYIWITLPIHVFGMRLIFPILLVGVTTSLSFIKVMQKCFMGFLYLEVLDASFSFDGIIYAKRCI